MKLLIIGPEVKTLAEVRNWSGVWSYYLRKTLPEFGVEVTFAKPHGDLAVFYHNLNVARHDHVLAIGSHVLDRVSHQYGFELMARAKGAVAQIHDSALVSSPVDCTFTVRACKPCERNWYVGWAADPEVCKPMQKKGTLRILVDHQDYGANRPDHSEQIVRRIDGMIASGIWKGRFDKVRVSRIIDGGIVDRAEEGFALQPYKRNTVSYERICAEYSATDIFMPTHEEGSGWSVIETATAGALIVTPKGCIHPERLALVRHVEFERSIPWLAVFDALDIWKSRQMAMTQSWHALCSRMLDYFRAFDGG